MTQDLNDRWRPDYQLTRDERYQLTLNVVYALIRRSRIVRFAFRTLANVETKLVIQSLLRDILGCFCVIIRTDTHHFDEFGPLRAYEDVLGAKLRDHVRQSIDAGDKQFDAVKAIKLDRVNWRCVAVEIASEDKRRRSRGVQRSPKNAHEPTDPTDTPDAS